MKSVVRSIWMASIGLAEDIAWSMGKGAHLFCAKCRSLSLLSLSGFGPYGRPETVSFKPLSLLCRMGIYNMCLYMTKDFEDVEVFDETSLLLEISTLNVSLVRCIVILRMVNMSPLHCPVMMFLLSWSARVPFKSFSRRSHWLVVWVIAWPEMLQCGI